MIKDALTEKKFSRKCFPTLNRDERNLVRIVHSPQSALSTSNRIWIQFNQNQLQCSQTKRTKQDGFASAMLWLLKSSQCILTFTLTVQEWSLSLAGWQFKGKSFFLSPCKWPHYLSISCHSQQQWWRNDLPTNFGFSLWFCAVFFRCHPFTILWTTDIK